MNEDETFAAAPRRSNTGTWMTLAVVAALFFIWVLFLRPQLSMKKATAGPGVGQPLAALELQPLTGTQDGLTLENVRGKVTLINFWGPWCGFCVIEFPHLVELWDKYRDKPDFKFVSVSSDGTGRDDVPALRESTRAFLKARSVSLPTYVDESGVSRQMVLDAMGRPSMGYPTTILLDRAGIIRGVWLGYESGYERQMEKLVATLLEEKPERK